jgi:PAS domain S-box-containing protein
MPKKVGQELAIRMIEDENNFRSLAEITTSALFICQGRRFKYANPAVEALTGYSRQELLGMSISAIFSSEARRFLRGIEQRLQAQDSPLHSELRLATKDGEARWVDLTLSAMEFRGKPAILGTAFDITVRKRAELLQDAVYRIAQAADRSTTLDDLFPSIHAIIGEVMIARNIYIALYDAATNTISYPYYVDEFDAPPMEAHTPGRGLTEWILRTGRSLLFTPEVQARLEGSGEVELIGTPSLIWLGVPLSIDSEVIGVMAVQDYQNPDAYTQQEQRMLEFVSSQVAMAIKRKRAEDALRENERRALARANEMAALFDTTRDLASPRDLSTLLQTIVTRAASLVGSSGGAIFLQQEEQPELELVVAHGKQIEPYIGTRISLGEGIAGIVAQARKPVFVNDYRNWENRSPAFDGTPIHAVLAAPMIYSGELLGVLQVFEFSGADSDAVRFYSQSEVNLMTFFADVAANAVHSARLFDETRQRLAELDLLYHASLAASQIHSLQAVAQRIVDTLDFQMDWKGSIWVIEDEKPVLLAYGSKGLSADQHLAEVERIKGLIRTLDDGIVGWVCKNGLAVRAGDVRMNPRYVISDPRVVSEMCVPLKSGGKTIGCINMESGEKDAFNEHDERLLTTLANHAAATIENARLFDETRRRALRQSALNTIIVTATHSELDLDTLLNTTLDQMLKALNLDMGAIWLSAAPLKMHRVASRGIPSSLSMMMTNAMAMKKVSLEKTLLISKQGDRTHFFADIFLQLDVESALVTPLIATDQRIGWLALASYGLKNWSAEDISLIEAIARELGAAAERARLFEVTRLRLNELETVNYISTALRRAQSLDAMLSELLSETLAALNSESGDIWLFDRDQHKLCQAVGKGWCTRMAHLDLKAGAGIQGTVFSTGDVLFSHDVSLDPLTPLPVRELVSAGWSAVCVPIFVDQETIGAMLVSVPLPREFDADHARLLTILADLAGGAIRRMQLSEETRRHAAELEERVASRTSELQKALEKAQEADRLKSEFIANINHELRTPLTNLVLYTQMLRAQPTIKTQERLDVINRELQRLRNLIEDLLNLSRLDLGQVRFSPTRRDLNDVVRSLAEDRRSLAEERKLTLSVELQPSLPAVLIDEALMVQVVSNLVTNALNYTPAGGHVWVRTMYTLKNEKRWVGLSVEDTGPGISVEERQRLFQRFFRGKAGQASSLPGTGLGLAIVKQVVDLHHGRIEVPPSPPSQGAIFRVWLPASEKETD